jgi:hypothetical protein
VQIELEASAVEEGGGEGTEVARVGRLSASSAAVAEGYKTVSCVLAHELVFASEHDPNKVPSGWVGVGAWVCCCVRARVAAAVGCGCGCVNRESERERERERSEVNIRHRDKDTDVTQTCVCVFACVCVYSDGRDWG